MYPTFEWAENLSWGSSSRLGCLLSGDGKISYNTSQLALPIKAEEFFYKKLIVSMDYDPVIIIGTLFFLYFKVLGMESMASHMEGKCSATDLYSSSSQTI